MALAGSVANVVSLVFYTVVREPYRRRSGNDTRGITGCITWCWCDLFCFAWWLLVFKIGCFGGMSALAAMLGSTKRRDSRCFRVITDGACICISYLH